MHAVDFNKQVDQAVGASLVALHGTERHLKTECLAKLCRTVLDSPMEDAIGLQKYPGKETEFRTVHDELAMVSMFSEQKIVLVEDAEEFVSKYRPQLEKYVEKPSKLSLLVLDVKTWRKNTKLAKKVAKTGIDVDCSELTGAKLSSWLVRAAKEEHGKQLTRDAAQLIPELAGTSMGLLNQELHKLTAYVGERERINIDDVRTLVGGWKAETTWTMINAIRDGDPNTALSCLQQLLHAGEPAPKILGGVNYVFRKFADATERSRAGQPLRSALKDSGMRPFEIDSAEGYLRRVKRPRAERILQKLAEADFHLKGGNLEMKNSIEQQLEHLVLWLGGAVPLVP